VTTGPTVSGHAISQIRIRWSELAETPDRELRAMVRTAVLDAYAISPGEGDCVILRTRMPKIGRINFVVSEDDGHVVTAINPKSRKRHLREKLRERKYHSDQRNFQCQPQG